jgi:hypothetical protein
VQSANIGCKGFLHHAVASRVPNFLPSRQLYLQNDRLALQICCVGGRIIYKFTKKKYFHLNIKSSPQPDLSPTRSPECAPLSSALGVIANRHLLIA